MIYLKVNELLKKNKKSIYWFVKNMGSGYQALSRLMENKTKSIHFDTLDKICDIFNCEPADIIVRKNNKKGKC